MVKDSHRTPGYSYRRSGITHLTEKVDDITENYAVHGDALNGIPDRIPGPEDARRAGTRPKDSPLKDTPLM